jgi:hypothetical protein
MTAVMGRRGEKGHRGEGMWITGGGDAGYEELGHPAMAADPVMRLLARCDEIEERGDKGVQDAEGRWIKCDPEEMQCLRSKGKAATWHARHVAGLLHARHYFTHAAATDGSLKTYKGGERRVAYGIYKGIQEGDAAPYEEKRAGTLRRVSKGMSGGGLPTSWEVIDAELYAIYKYFKEVAREPGGETRGSPRGA